ncbi:MAG: crossover junction endodeoxyribonuclease RuvC [Alphaproteobacteria bacterium]|nr:crossover junction endodeoxyribonuclease RuvC [Alphaproteobacteria bacterium]MDI9329893.1 crossover junction endodeoxyribonuclease RuvC [Alphaproteobacteria bacterium]
MRVLGIDPGLRLTGFGLIEAQGQQLSYLASGTISTADAPTNDLPARIGLLFASLNEVIGRYQPEVAALEIVFVNVNPQATLKLGQARGACLCALSQAGVPVQEYTALQMKQAVAGHGKAAKAQVQEMVRRLLDLPGLPGPDAADALGLAITHAHAHRSLHLLRGQRYASEVGRGYRQGRLA